MRPRLPSVFHLLVVMLDCTVSWVAVSALETGIRECDKSF